MIDSVPDNSRRNPANIAIIRCIFAVGAGILLLTLLLLWAMDYRLILNLWRSEDWRFGRVLYDNGFDYYIYMYWPTVPVLYLNWILWRDLLRPSRSLRVRGFEVKVAQPNERSRSD